MAYDLTLAVAVQKFLVVEPAREAAEPRNVGAKGTETGPDKQVRL